MIINTGRTSTIYPRTQAIKCLSGKTVTRRQHSLVIKKVETIANERIGRDKVGFVRGIIFSSYLHKLKMKK